MRNLVSALTAVVLVCLGVIVWQGLGGVAPAQDKPAAAPAAVATKWEYKVVDGHFTADTLDRYGAEGWELVSHSVASTGQGITSTSHWYIFKRPKK